MDTVEFNKLVDKYYEDTWVLSFVKEDHESYKKLVKAGKDILPLILGRMDEELNSEHGPHPVWIQLLIEITGETVGKPEDSGKVEVLCSAWRNYLLKNLGGRDPKRITRILDKLKKVWETSPDLRLGQLIINYSTKYNITEIRGQNIESLYN